MSDDTNNRGPADRARISVEQDHEVRYWTQALDCTEEQLREAVAAVGPSVDEVRQHLTGGAGTDAP